jgi:hypothetical protein
VGFFRGIIKSFSMSNIKKLLIEKKVKFHPVELCPYCKAKLWNLKQPKMIPRSASVRLDAYDKFFRVLYMPKWPHPWFMRSDANF